MDIREGFRAVCGFALIIGAGCLVLLASTLFLIIAVPVSIATAVLADGWPLNPDNNPVISEWFAGLMQPDQPYMSCCGRADAFEADEWDGPSGDGKTITVTITDGRGVMPTGTKIVVPVGKIKWDQGNPTGHGILFIGSQGQIYCYVVPGGV